MKAMRLENNCKSGHTPGQRSRAAALMATVAICVCAATRLDAVVIDNFEGPVKWTMGGGGTNYFQFGLANGQMVISKQNPIRTPRPGVLGTYDSVYWPPPYLPADGLEEGRTLELRMDLNHTSIDNLFLHLGCGSLDPADGADSAYIAIVDQNEVALMKYKYPGGMTTFYWDTLATTNENVTFRLAFSKTNSALVITVKVVDKGNQRATLYERSFVDGPGQDGPVPPPDPHGYGFFGPDLGGPYTNFTYAGVGCSQMIFTIPPPLEMRLDNLEYDVYHPPHLEIAQATNDVDLTWQLPLEEQIVVQATNLAGPWCPCPQPYTRTTNDLFCLTLPCQSPQQFFKLTPGWQFAEDFSVPNPLWVPWFQDAGEEWTVTNGALRLDWDAPVPPGLALCARGATNAEAVLRDVCMSVDLLDCVTSSTNKAVLALAARAILDETGGTTYFGGVSVNYGGVRGAVRPWILGDDYIYTYGVTINVQDYPLPYRLQFSVVGNKLQLRVLHLATGQYIGGEVNAPGSDYATGIAALWVNGQNNPGDSFTIIADNFFLSGTKP